jgi:hypothetical protein
MERLSSGMEQQQYDMNVTSKSKTTIMGMIMGHPHSPGMMMVSPK